MRRGAVGSRIAASASAPEGRFARPRARMVERLEADGIRDAEVLDAMAQVPRHAFVDEALHARAYADVALPIGLGQTISQPFVVARMTSLVFRAARERDLPLLEVGFGCAYQSAVLAALGVRVVAVERIASFVTTARERLHALGITGVRLVHGDGRHGWVDAAPFGAMLVAAAAPQVPAALLGQLAMGGRLVMPVGDADAQVLTGVVRTPQGFVRRRLDAVHFVPLVPGEPRS